MNSWTEREGLRLSRGNLDRARRALYFALYSEHTMGITLLLYSERNITTAR
jgi:hypothetical protein